LADPKRRNAIFVIVLIVAYLCGSIPSGVLIGKWLGFDPRAVGSHNVGMTNVARAGGKSAAALTFLADVSKGLLPVLLARALLGPIPTRLAVIGLAAFIGSIASIFLGFAGGRGVATSVGVWLGLAPLPMAMALAVFATILAVGRMVSLASLGAAMALPALVATTGAPHHYVLLAIVMSALVLLRHRANILRLMSGEEPHIGSKGAP
jgi:glycerol-3-phosphate acyltransferase PlsY